MGFEVLLHHTQRLIALLHPLLDGMHLQFAPAFDEHKPEMSGAHIRLKAVLLKEHPLQRFGAVESTLRYKRRTAGEIPKDGSGFRQIAPGRSFEQRYVPTWILGAKVRRSGIALEDVDLHQVIRNGKLREREPHFVAIAGALHRVEREHSRFPASVSRMRHFPTHNVTPTRGKIAGRMRPQYGLLMPRSVARPHGRSHILCYRILRQTPPLGKRPIVAVRRSTGPRRQRPQKWKS